MLRLFSLTRTLIFERRGKRTKKIRNLNDPLVMTELGGNIIHFLFLQNERGMDRLSFRIQRDES